MPVKIPKDLPARRLLENENVFVMTETRALHQDIRPLKIAILNLMPTKIETETQLLRLLGNTPLQIEIALLHMGTHASKNTSQEHLKAFYATFDDIREKRFDGLIITGAPVETLEFEKVDYWPELKQILDWSATHVFSTLCICWGAQAALYHFYGVKKYPLPAKCFGVFKHKLTDSQEPIVRGFDDGFPAPHSRHTEIKTQEILDTPGLKLIAESEEAGTYLVVSDDGRRIFVTGHPEYDRGTLKQEYDRDVGRGLLIEKPRHYFPADDANLQPPSTWRSHANLLYSNWLNYYVYQATPYDLNDISHESAVSNGDDYMI